MIFVIAQSHNEYKSYIRINGLPVHDYRFVTRPESLYGLRDVKIVIVNKFRIRNRTDFLDVIQTRNLPMEYTNV